MLDDRVGGIVQRWLKTPGARFNKGNVGITIRTGDIISTDMKRIASYDERKPDNYWKLEIRTEIGCLSGNWIGSALTVGEFLYFRGISVFGRTYSECVSVVKIKTVW